MLIDTHCHLDEANCPGGPDTVLERARAVGVGAFLTIGVGSDLSPAREAVALARRRSDVRAAVGLHPHDARKATPVLREDLARLAACPEVVAVGEIGLDYHYDHSPRKTQQEVFRYFLGLARTLKKPAVIHTRKAPQDTLEILRDERAQEVGGIIHCFSEDLSFARQALDLSFFLSFSGIVTFKNARAIQEVAAWAPADRILVETDAPYLAPVPHRGKRCEPAYVVHTARFIAQLRGVSLETIAEQTTRNARQLSLLA
ncbi:MAG: TatD family hydrolase [Myxococcales bacterium]|nr:TatD family hydrolase [Polyangiaceae bacterium]MDW8249517.1 TatD family hydrolase [Myxococcales bacterium]